MIPFKKLLAMPPVPCSEPPKSVIIYCEAVRRDINGKAYYEFDYYTKIDRKARLQIRAFTDGESVRIRNEYTDLDSKGDLAYQEVRFDNGRGHVFCTAVIDSDEAKAICNSLFGHKPTLSSYEHLSRLQSAKLRKKREKIRRKNEEFQALAFSLLKHYDESEFFDFIQNTVMPEHYIFMYRPKKHGGRIGYCTHCEKWVNVTGDIRHNDANRCPECDYAVIYKDLRRGAKTLWQTGIFQIIEKIGADAVALRTYETRVDYSNITEHTTDLPVKICEHTRHIINLNGVDARYEYQYVWNSSAPNGYEWRHIKTFDGSETVRYSYWNNYNAYQRRRFCPNATWIYLPGSEAALNETRLKYVDFLGFWEKERSFLGVSVPECIHAYISDYFKYPVYEFLYKAKARRLIIHAQNGRFGIELKNKTVPEIFCGLPQRYVAELLKYDPMPADIANAGTLYSAGIYSGNDTLKKFVNVACRDGLLPPIKHIGLLPEKAKQYKYSMSIYGDYIDDCVKLGYDLCDKYIEFPKDLISAHAHTTALIEVKKDPKTDKKIRDREEKVNKKYRYENDKFIIRAMHDMSEFIIEAKYQNNCVASIYMSRYSRDECIILVVRKKSAPDLPYITVEVKKDKIIQYYCKGNKTPKELKDYAGEKFRREYENAVLKPLLKEAKAQ